MTPTEIAHEIPPAAFQKAKRRHGILWMPASQAAVIRRPANQRRYMTRDRLWPPGYRPGGPQRVTLRGDQRPADAVERRCGLWLV